MQQEAALDKSSPAFQRTSWEALKKSLNGIVNKLTAANLRNLIPEIFTENLVRGRGLLARSFIRAQNASPSFTPVYAALLAIINTKFPQAGELVLKRLVLQFRNSFRRNDKAVCIAATKFIAHLVNQQVAYEIIALQIITLLLERPTDSSVEVAIAFLKECGSFLAETSPRALDATFDRLRSILHDGDVSIRVQYMIEVAFALRKESFKDFPQIPEGLDLVEEEDQITHFVSLDDDALSGEDELGKGGGRFFLIIFMFSLIYSI